MASPSHRRITPCTSSAAACSVSRRIFSTTPETLEPETAASLASELGAALPYVAEMALAVTHGGALGRCDDDTEFEFALDLILDGLDRLQSS